MPLISAVKFGYWLYPELMHYYAERKTGHSALAWPAGKDDVIVYSAVCMYTV